MLFDQFNDSFNSECHIRQVEEDNHLAHILLPQYNKRPHMSIYFHHYKHKIAVMVAYSVLILLYNLDQGL